MNYKFSFSIFLAILAIAAGSFIYVFKMQEGKQVVGEWWLVNTYQFKGMAADSIKSKKIIVLSGSNSLFSINADTITSKTGFPVVNLATHAGLDLNYHFYILKKHMKKGDIVVMPLEYEYYTSSGKSTDWFVNNMTGWGHDYVSSLPAYDYINFLMNVTPKRILEGFSATDKGYIEPISSVYEKFKTADGSYNGYSYKSMDKFGDINYITNEKTVFENIEKGSFDYSSNISAISDYSANKLKSIKSFVEGNGGTFVLTWPVTMRNPLFDTDISSTINNLARLKSLLHDRGLEIKCSPSASNLGRKFFMDSAYHTNGYGALIRSTFLGECLNTVINGKGGYNDNQNFRAVVLEMESKTPFHD